MDHIRARSSSYCWETDLICFTLKEFDNPAGCSAGSGDVAGG
jgi:hypothetical protein